MGEKPEAGEDLRTQGAGSGIAIDEEGVQRQGDAMSSIGNIRAREAGGAGGAGEPAESANLNLSKSNINRVATDSESIAGDSVAEGSVKSSKSNTSD